MDISWHDILGIVGVALIVGSYLLLQLDRMESRAPIYSVLNAVGAALILMSLLVDFNLSAFVIESFWIVISLVGLYRSLRSRGHSERDPQAATQGDT